MCRNTTTKMLQGKIEWTNSKTSGMCNCQSFLLSLDETSTYQKSPIDCERSTKDPNMIKDVFPKIQWCSSFWIAVLFGEIRPGTWSTSYLAFCHIWTILRSGFEWMFPRPYKWQVVRQTSWLSVRKVPVTSANLSMHSDFHWRLNLSTFWLQTLTSAVTALSPDFNSNRWLSSASGLDSKLLTTRLWNTMRCVFKTTEVFAVFAKLWASPSGCRDVAGQCFYDFYGIFQKDTTSQKQEWK